MRNTAGEGIGTGLTVDFTTPESDDEGILFTDLVAGGNFDVVVGPGAMLIVDTEFDLISGGPGGSSRPVKKSSPISSAPRTPNCVARKLPDSSHVGPEPGQWAYGCPQPNG